MRLSTVARSLASGLLVYVLAAACAASERASDVAGDGGGPSAMLDAIADGVADPVKEASAEPLPPDVATEKCDKVAKYAGQDAYIAEHAYPGKSAHDLAALRLVLGPSTELEGYSQRVGVAQYVRDGSAAVFCGYVSAGTPKHSVTFILPR